MGNINKHFKPNFFIPGAAKSGTTTLHDLLNTHPQISMSTNKEPVYWNNKSFEKYDNFEKNRYANLFDENANIKGESTTSYMSSSYIIIFHIFNKVIIIHVRCC